MPRGVKKKDPNAPLPSTPEEALAGTPTEDKAEVARILEANAALQAELAEAKKGSAHAAAPSGAETPSSHPDEEALAPSLQAVMERIRAFGRDGYLGHLRVAEADLRRVIVDLSR